MNRRGWQEPTARSRVRDFIDRVFVERQLVVRTEGRVGYYQFSQKSQIAATIAFVAVVSWGLFTSLSFVFHDRVLQAKDNEIAGARLAYRSLLNEVAEYQRKFAAITKDLEENHALMLGLVEKNAALQRNLSSVTQRLSVTEADRQEVIDGRERLKRQLAAIEHDMKNATSRNFSLKDNLNTAQSNLQMMKAERNKALQDSEHMGRRVDELTERLKELQESEGEVVQRMNERAGEQIASLENVVKLSGLKVDRLLKSPDVAKGGVGGPFIPTQPDGLPASDLRIELANLEGNLDRLQALQDSMTRLPLAAPLSSYYITSTFGKRKDPMTKRWSAHYGLDMGGRLKAPVYSTAPGKVTHAGWKGRYGRLVEIDHGAGLKTRYGHLSKVLVKKGQIIKFHEEIGLLGNSGRSTGPHLHYEVEFHGKPMNPLKFIRAGRYVFKDK